MGNSATLRPPSEIGSDVEAAQIESIASFLNLKELNKMYIFIVNREKYIYFVKFITAVGKAMQVNLHI